MTYNNITVEAFTSFSNAVMASTASDERASSFSGVEVIKTFSSVTDALDKYDCGCPLSANYYCKPGPGLFNEIPNLTTIMCKLVL